MVGNNLLEGRVEDLLCLVNAFTSCSRKPEITFLPPEQLLQRASQLQPRKLHLNHLDPQPDIPFHDRGSSLVIIIPAPAVEVLNAEAWLVLKVIAVAIVLEVEREVLRSDLMGED